MASPSNSGEMDGDFNLFQEPEDYYPPEPEDKIEMFVQDKTVLELGAAGALPSLVSACNGASRVVITDYPDHDLVENIRRNVRANIPEDKVARGLVAVEGFKWGYDIEKIAQLSTQNGTFDVLILSDLVFNHSEHSALLRS
ncbi:Protein N-terminal and lysine N-methyltransferase efm7, partial [Coemansia sp. RSA 2681]